jgi:hypothetical protein
MQRGLAILAQPRIYVHLVDKLTHPADVALASGSQKITFPTLTALIGAQPKKHRDGGKD